MKTFYGFKIPSQDEIKKDMAKIIAVALRRGAFFALLWAGSAALLNFGSNLSTLFKAALNVLLYGSGVITVVFVALSVFVFCVILRTKLTKRWWLHRGAQLLQTEISSTIVPNLIIEEIERVGPIPEGFDLLPLFGLIGMSPVVNGEPYKIPISRSDGASMRISFPVVVDENGDGRVIAEVL